MKGKSGIVTGDAGGSAKRGRAVTPDAASSTSHPPPSFALFRARSVSTWHQAGCNIVRTGETDPPMLRANKAGEGVKPVVVAIPIGRLAPRDQANSVTGIVMPVDRALTHVRLRPLICEEYFTEMIGITIFTRDNDLAPANFEYQMIMIIVNLAVL